MLTGPGDKPVARTRPKKKAPDAPAYQPPSAAGKDTKSNADRSRADVYKKTKAYRGAVRAGYKGSQDRKQALADNIATARTGEATTEQQTVFKTHSDAVRGSQKNAASRAGKDTKGNDERQRALKFLADHPEILSPKKDGGGGIGGAISDVFHKVYGGGDKGKGGSAVAAARPGSLGGATLRGATGGGLYAIPKNVGLTLAEDPKRQIPKLAGDTAKSIVSIPAGLVAATVHPLGTAKAIGEDYAHRYGDLARGDEQAFRERLRKEGVAPETFDIASAALGAAGGAGKIAQVAAKAGRLGDVAERIATERPAMRVSGNVSKPQPIHENFGRNVVSAGRDAARRKVQTKRASQENASLEVRQAAATGSKAKQAAFDAVGRAVERERKARQAWENADRPTHGPVAAERLAAEDARRAADEAYQGATDGPGEVTHIRKRKGRNEQQKMVAGAKGRRLTAMKAEGQREEAAARKNVNSLSKPERRALNYAMKFGIHDAETARREIPQWLERIKAERAKHEASTGKKIPDKQNEIPELEYLLAHADEAFTPATARVAQEEGARAARVGASDPGFDNSVADRRRHIAQAEFTGEARPLSKDEATTAVREAKSAVTEAEKHLRRVDGATDVRAAEAALDDARATLKRATEIKADGGYVVKGTALPPREQFIADRPKPATGHPDPDLDTLRMNLETRGTPGVHVENPRLEYTDPKSGFVTGLGDELGGLKAVVERDSDGHIIGALRMTLDEKGHADILEVAVDPAHRGKGVATRLYRAAEEAGLKVEAASGRGGLTEAGAALKHKRLSTHPSGESVVTASELEAAHLPRIVNAARERGLQEPHYTPSEKRPMGGFSAFAVGGKKAVQASKRYEGSLLRTGRENTSPEAHILSIQKGIKRKHNWNLVADTFDEHAAADPALRHQTLSDLRDELDRRGIDPDTVAFWNPGRYKAERQHLDKAVARAAENGEVTKGGDVEITDPTFESRSVQDVLGESTIDHIDSASSQFAGTNGWSVIPRAVYDEIHADVKPSGKVGRTYDVARGKVSRLLLGNPAWLQFQVASNGLMTGLAGVGPVDAIRAQRWWKSLSTAERDAIEPYVGVHVWYDDQRHLGASANSRMVNAYRAFKTTSFYRVAHKGNPLDLLFKADNAQNNFFRRAVFYNRVKREAYKNMGREASKAMAAQQRIIDGIMGRSPEEAMRALVKDGATIEKHAQAVNDFLGNWSTYTARERKLFSRSVMFYGFMRFSVKLAFYTMPIEHPLMSSILLHVGHLQADELEKLFGGDVPVWELGSYYDHGHKFNLARLNPFFNALQYQGPGQLVGNLGPLANVLIDQLAGKNVAFDKLFTVDGSTKYVQKGKDLSFADRVNIMASEMEKISPYVRMAERFMHKNRQTSDSWLLHPRNTGSPGLGEKSHNLGDVLKEGLVPVAGEDGHPALRAAKALGGPKVTVTTGSAGRSPGAPPALPALPPLPELPPLPRIN